MKTKLLPIKFHGKILDQLGGQAYQSPVASISELVANAWDADATRVDITLPEDKSGQITVTDNGVGMTLDECKDAYLNIGYDKRKGNPAARTRKGRRIMGRKGIGKFAGFGIARINDIETVSAKTGQKTTFVMDFDRLVSDEYISSGEKIDAGYTEPDPDMQKKHGTKVVLKKLRIGRNVSKTQFPGSLARRFLVHHTVEDFKVRVNGTPIPQSMDTSAVEFSFPKDYPDKKRPDGLEQDGEWGVENIGENKIRWRVGFAKSPISDEDRQGITVFANGKLAQKAFLFNLPGAPAGYHGTGYMFGQVIADFLEDLDVDVMSIERQRINWSLDSTMPLLDWGRNRTKEILRLWGELKADQKYDRLKNKVSGFDERLSRLKPHERHTAEKVLQKLASVTLISDKNYEEMAGSILTAFERGRLYELWNAIANKTYTSNDELLEILIETDVVSALNVAEAVRTKLNALHELKDMVDQRCLEHNLRDHISKHPWIIAPKWDMFKREKGINSIVEQAADQSRLSDSQYKGRVDLVLSSGESLLVLEFMKPGLTLDFDHLQRCERYVINIREHIKRKTASPHKYVTGYIVADNLDKDQEMTPKIGSLEKDGIIVNDWQGLFSEAESQWGEYLEILSKRGDDSRLARLAEGIHTTGRK